jgi:vacuolar protein sorting-associated protein 13A/C
MLNLIIRLNAKYRKLPKIDLKLRAPLQLENLLPYNLEYRIYDKNTDQNWRSYLRKGGTMPVHSVEVGHFVLLNVNLPDTGMFVVASKTPIYSF